MNGADMIAGRRFLFMLCGFDLGGAERQALHLARHLKALGGDVRVWGHHHRDRGPEAVITQCEAAGIPWEEYRFRWPCRKAEFVRDLWRLWRGMCRWRPSVLLPYTPWPSIACGLVWRATPARVCIWGQRNSDDLQADRVTRAALERSTAAICNSEHVATYLRGVMGVRAVPTHVVPNGVELAPPQRGRAAWRAALDIAPDAVVATMLANFRPQKDHLTVLEAWRRVMDGWKGGPTPSLVLAGAPQDTFVAVRDRVAALGLASSVRLPGAVDDVAGLLGASDIGLLCSRYEGLPNAVLEYMAAGLPVIAVDLPGTRAALGPHASEALVARGDAAALAHRLDLLMADENMRRAWGGANRRIAATRHSPAAMGNAMVAILADCLRAAG